MFKSYGYNYLTPLDDLGDRLMYCKVSDEWIPSEKSLRGIKLYHQTYKHISSLRAAKRHLRKHNEIRKGSRFILAGRYVGVPTIILTKG